MLSYHLDQLIVNVWKCFLIPIQVPLFSDIGLFLKFSLEPYLKGTEKSSSLLSVSSEGKSSS